MRPPPFILVLKSNAPGFIETARTKGGKNVFPRIRIRFRNGKYGVLWVLAFCSRFSPTRAAQRRGLVCWYTPVLCPIASHKAAQGQHGGILPHGLQNAAVFCSLSIKWGRASARKLCRLLLASSQTLCLPHPRVGKIVPALLVQATFSPWFLMPE
mgnify:FL=1